MPNLQSYHLQCEITYAYKGFNYQSNTKDQDNIPVLCNIYLNIHMGFLCLFIMLVKVA